MMHVLFVQNKNDKTIKLHEIFYETYLKCLKTK